MYQKLLFIILTLLFNQQLYADIVCKVSRIGKDFYISTNKIGMIDKKITNRSLASQEGYYFLNFTSKTGQKSLTKSINFEGQKYTLHIKDKNNFSEINDYLSIQSAEGHEVIYPINCN